MYIKKKTSKFKKHLICECACVCLAVNMYVCFVEREWISSHMFVCRDLSN